MADVFEVLSHDHREVERMLAELESGTAPAGLDGPELRGKMVEQLIIEESKHEAVEEEYFWPAVRELVPDGDRLADHAVEEEQAAKQVLDDLLGLEAGEAKFEELLSGFIADAREHIAYEEKTVWPQLRSVIGTDRAAELGKKLVEGKKTAPTRPHPHTPPKPGVLKTAGRAVAAADRLRDRATGRDQG
ncbi:hemerythrin domain-containing protein [Microbispora sp. RL4-1S]|uniref:Hemerythrin domain-containing protein n=1 Tax=Microbispora oryzae TaxID=2806554 RepID=A0A940WQU3_9ACTN|nr:hemerythrin domain-containing protein [Microbispora oryzae]MBP2707887.1 hemerythrin domain-containing protein [Microbispora oryzae]